jgi:hypothetical protein
LRLAAAGLALFHYSIVHLRRCVWRDVQLPISGLAYLVIELFLDCERFSLSQHEAFRILNLGVVFADFCNFFAAFDKKQVFGFGKRRIPQDGKFDWEQDDPSLHSPKFCHFPTLEITVQSFDCIMSAHHKFPGLILIYPKTEIQWQHHLQLQTNRCHL